MTQRQLLKYRSGKSSVAIKVTPSPAPASARFPHTHENKKNPAKMHRPFLSVCLLAAALSSLSSAQDVDRRHLRNSNSNSNSRHRHRLGNGVEDVRGGGARQELLDSSSRHSGALYAVDLTHTLSDVSPVTEGASPLEMIR